MVRDKKTVIKAVCKEVTAIACVIVFMLCLSFSAKCWSEGLPRITLEVATPQKINLVVGKSVIVGSPEMIKRVSLADPAIADVMVLTPRQIYLVGKVPGLTNLTLWDAKNTILAMAELEIIPDIARLKEKLHEMFPEEKDIMITTSNNSITLSGTVSSSANLSQVIVIAESYACGKEKEKGCGGVINMLEVAGVHQVMLEVRVSEISRSLLKELGINFAGASKNGNLLGIGTLGGLSQLTGVGGGTAASGAVNAFFRFLGGGATWTLYIDALKEDGLAKILAEPTLITLSGKTASFLAGGEFPIPVPQSIGSGGGQTITIEYKTFGVGLNFTPTVLSSNKISMQVSPEVSELDFSNSQRFQGFVVPALTTRRASTVIELADGQSFAIAGLLKDEVRSQSSKYPFLGDIPILGQLFTSQSFRKSESELVIIATPHLVKPLDLSKQTLPTDQYIEPNDFEFYLLGKMQGKGDVKSPSAVPSSPEGKTGGLEGEFGHAVP